MNSVALKDPLVDAGPYGEVSPTAAGIVEVAAAVKTIEAIEAIKTIEALRDTLAQQRPGRCLPKCSRASRMDHQTDTAPTGIEAIDGLIGGLPRGRITEIYGPESSGRTSLLLSSIAQITNKEEFCGLVDPGGMFDPVSAQSTGIDLDRILWIRTGRNVDRTLKTLDLLIQGGGFGLIGVDLDSLAASELRGVPLSSWFRFQRAVAHTPTILLFISREPMIRAAASLVLTLKPEGSGCFIWSQTLLHGIRPRIEIVRSRANAAMPGRCVLFGLQSADCLHAVSADPDILSNNAPQGVSCHES